MKRLLQTAIVIVTTIGVQACEGPRDIGPRQQVAAIADIPSDTSITEQMRVCLGMFNEYAVNSEMERYFHDISSVTKDEVCNSIREMRDLEGNAIINGSVFSGSDRQRFEETACNTSETLIKYIRDGEYTSEWLSDRFYESFDRCLAIPSTQIRAPRLSVRASLIDQGNRVRFLLRAIEPHPIHGFKIGMSSRGLHTCNAIQNGTALDRKSVV